MPMSDCSECWETPCICGKGYAHLSDDAFGNFIKNITDGRKAIMEEQKSCRTKQ